MLEGIEVDVAAVEGLIGQVVGIKDDQVEIDVGIILVEDILGGVPVLVGGAADADLHDGLSLLVGLIAVDEVQELFVGVLGIFILKGRDESLAVLRDQVLTHEVGLEGFLNGLVELIVLILGAGDDNIHKRVSGVSGGIGLALDGKTVTGRNKPGGDGIGAVDGGAAEVVQRSGQGVGLGRDDLDVVEIPGDILQFGNPACFGIDGDEADALQELDGAAAVGGVVGNADQDRGGGGCGDGARDERGQKQNRNQSDECTFHFVFLHTI